MFMRWLAADVLDLGVEIRCVVRTVEDNGSTILG